MLLRFRRLLRLISKDVLILFFACRDPLTPGWIKFGLVAILAYWVLPIDFISDLIPFLGWLDDAVIVGGGLTILLRCLPKLTRETAQVKVAQFLNKLPSWWSPK